MVERRIVQCVAAFTVGSKNGPVVVNVGDLYFADDPIVDGREALFSDVIVKESGPRKSSRTPVGSIEEATAAPTGRRRMSRPKDEPKPEGENKDGEV